MKHAVIIVYDGEYPSIGAQQAAAAAIAQYGFIHDLEKVEMYVLDESAIVTAIAGAAIKAAAVQEETNEEWAIRIVYTEFKDSLISADFEEFTTSLAVKLAVELASNSDLVRAVRILAKEGAEQAISDEVKIKYGLTQRVFQSIRRTLNLVCQGRHIIFR